MSYNKIKPKEDYLIIDRIRRQQQLIKPDSVEQQAKQAEKNRELRELKKKKQGKPQYENANITLAHFSRYQLFDTSCTCLALMGVVLSAIEYELEFQGRLEQESKIILWVIFISCLFNAAFTIIRYKSYLEYKKSRRDVSQVATLKTADLLMPMLFEFFLVLIHPNPFLVDIKLKFKNDWSGDSGDQELYYKLNEILSFFSITKLFLVLRTILLSTKWYTNKSHRVCRMYEVEPNLLFLCKCVMKYNPYTFMTFCYGITIVFFGFGIHIAESALVRGQEILFYSYFHSFWCIIITMTTVGYGDYYPHSLLGRFIILIVCIIGTLITSLMVLSLFNTLNISQFEDMAICVLDKLHSRRERKIKAAECLGKMGRIYQIFKKSKQILQKEINKEQLTPTDYQESDKLEKNFHNIKKSLVQKIKQYSSITDNYKSIKVTNEIQEIQRQFEHLQKENVSMKQNINDILIDKIIFMQKIGVSEERINFYQDEIESNLIELPKEDAELDAELLKEEDDIQIDEQMLQTQKIEAMTTQNNYTSLVGYLKNKSEFKKQETRQSLISQGKHITANNPINPMIPNPILKNQGQAQEPGIVISKSPEQQLFKIQQ